MSYHKIIASPETVQWGRFDAAIPPILTVELAIRVELECVTGLAELYPPEAKGDDAEVGGDGESDPAAGADRDDRRHR